MEQLRRSGEVSITNDGATKAEVLQPAAKMLDTIAPNEEAGGPKVGKGRQQILMHGTGNDDLEITKAIQREIASLKVYSPEELKALDLSNVISKGESSSALVVQDDEEVDEEGVVPQAIEVVMCHTAVSRPKAVKALKAADGDIVSAIMELVS